MENYQKNVVEDSNKSVRSEPTSSRITFEYTYPTRGGGVESMDDDSTTSSNKSTPYYTPLEFFQSSFEFPSPVLDKTHTFSPKRTTSDDGASELATAMDTAAAAATIETSTTRRAPKASSPGGAFKQQLQQSQQSPALSRKMRRFSLYERRSCSPQHMLMRDVGGSETHGDKENTKPRHCDKPDDPATSYLLASSGNNSPKLAATGLIDESSSPKILTVANDSGGLSGNSNSSRLIYSPKLLASISNLNLSGSPLSLINSASYKNGNYFKFPEIDQIVQSESVAAGSNGDGSTESSSDATVVAVTGATITTTTSPSSNSDNQTLSQSIVPVKVVAHSIDPTKSDMKKNRKNKNNLTIKIRDPPAMKGGNTPSPSPKLKTPTIKNTKEKALSLDSAAVESEPKKVTFGASCDEIDSNAQNSAALLQLRQRRAMTADKHHNQYGGEQSTNLHSTSLSHLTTLTDFHGGGTPAVFVSKPGGSGGGGGGITRTPRRRVMAGSSSNDWLQYHRKQNPYNLNVDSAKRSASDTDSSEKSFFDGDVVVLHEDDEVQCEEAETQFIQIPTVVSAATSTATPRNIFKHNPLLHSSSTNLKTLPEFLTLVEFNAGTGSSSSSEHRSPYKQKSMELPVTAQQPCMMNTPAILHTKHVGTSNSSTNLLQRRGSNHSLTLNLHGSCSNLLGSCRSGLSVSNYSLGSVGNSTTNLNVTQSSIVPTTVTQATLSTQNAKQSLFRRRGSNHSLTLTNLTATSCGNLNAFASQNCLNLENSGVTRTTSFITPTNNTASSTNTSFITKKGLLERRGSNQSLTLNMNSSLAVSSGNIHDTLVVDRQQQKLDPNCCSHANQRKFFSSENLNKSNAPFGDLNQTHKRNANQVCFGSVSDLKPRDMGPQVHGTAAPAAGKRDSSEFPESTVCTCTGVRNIMTRPLSPQATSEEFKIYLAGIQMLQNASNPLNQEELIKLNFIFDNSYATNKNLIDQPLPSVLNMHSSRDVESPLGITYTSDDFEVVKKYEEAVHDILHHVRPSEDEQKRMFRDLHKEFWDLPLNHQEKPMVFGSQTKNRYKTILPNENSRFILAKEDQSCDLTKLLDENNVIISTMDKHNGSSSVLDEQPYINANYIKGPDYASKCYVATQGPLPNTIFEFWLMVYQNTKRFLYETNDANAGQCYGNLKQYYQKIVMLTNFLENNRQKCSVYFPVELHEIFAIIKHQESWHLSDLAKNYFNEFLMATEDKEFALNDEQIKIECITTTLSEELARELPLSGSFFVLKNVGIVRKNGFSIRKLVMLYCMQFSEISSNAVRQQKLCINRLICYHYWYPDWPDHRSPRDINALLDICLHILNLGKCESEFENFNLTDESLKAHLMAQKIDAYQQDLFNAVQPLPVIHCSAGIGRTGCLTAILNAIRQLRQSFSYSLTTMAQELRLKLLQEPALDVEIADSHWNLINLCNDTDSSFTRNTLFYILHIVHGQELQEKGGGGLIMNTQKRKHEEVVVVGGDQGDDQETTRPISVRQLPKLPDIFVDCLGIVCNLRLQRGGMVQNSEQYELIHRAICLYMKRTFALKRF